MILITAITTATVILFLIGIGFIFAELLTGTLSLLFIGIGGIVASIFHYFTHNLPVSLSIFGAISLISIIPFMKLVNKKGRTGYQSGIHRFIGESATVQSVESDDLKKGTIKLHGETWGIQCEQTLKLHETIIITDIKGATFTVKHKGAN